MSLDSVVDLAILGGGCAGLSLASELAAYQSNRSVVVIEPRQAYVDDRSWCFWGVEPPNSQPPGQVLPPVSHRWPRWAFGLAHQPPQLRQAASLSYQYVRSSDFYQHCLDRINTSPSVSLHLGQTVESVVPVAKGWQVSTDEQVLMARHVIDTRPPAPAHLAQATLQQVFVGVELELDGQGSVDPTAVDPTTVELMTDMRVVDDAFCFTYVLPLSATRLLAEVTFFARKVPSESVLEQTLNELLVQRGWHGAQIVRREWACLPMGLPLEVQSPARPVRAGMAGGALRASSGYGFLRIQRWAKQCAQHYHATGNVLGHPQPGFAWRWMDQLFLDVIAAEPGLAPMLFERLLGRTDPTRFVRFMHDEASWLDCLKVIGCLPSSPFLRALARRMAHRLEARR